MLAKLLDKNDDGKVMPEEIGCFFYDIWDDENARMKINTISKADPIDQENARSYLLVQQCCKELGLDYYFEIMKRKGINTKMFLNSSYETLKDALKEIESEHISLLWMKAQAHNDRKNFYYDIQKRAMIVEADALKVAHQVENALAEGKLTKTERDGDTYMIEDPEGGNGLCVFENKNKEQMLCRRRGWKAHGFPGRYTNNSANSFYIMCYGKFARMGPYVFYSE